MAMLAAAWASPANGAARRTNLQALKQLIVQALDHCNEVAGHLGFLAFCRLLSSLIRVLIRLINGDVGVLCQQHQDLQRRTGMSMTDMITAVLLIERLHTADACRVSSSFCFGVREAGVPQAQMKAQAYDFRRGLSTTPNDIGWS